MFARWHGIDTLVRRYIESRASGQNKTSQLQLFLIGDGPTFSDLQSIVLESGYSDEIIFSGRIDHDAIPEALSAMDIGVLPNSNIYGSPMKLFEFMAMGIPMVAPNYEPVTAVINDRENGWLFEAGNIDACLATILKLAEEPSPILPISKSARNDILEHHTWRNNVRHCLNSIASSDPNQDEEKH